MAAVSVLVRLDLAPDLDPAAVAGRLTEVGKGGVAARVNVAEGDEDGRYVNATFSTANRRAIWAAVREELAGGGARPSLLGCSIVDCTGEFDWDDYLLLHHFRESEQLDEVPAEAEPGAAADGGGSTAFPGS